MKCDDLKDLVSSYADGELDGARREFIETHLKSCPDCQALLTEYRRAGYKLSSLRHMPQTLDIGPRTMARIKSPPAAPKRSWFWRPAFISIPVVIALVITLIVNLPGGEQPITASVLVQHVLQNSGNIKSFRSDSISILTTHSNNGDYLTSTESTSLFDLASQRSYTTQTVTTTSIIGIVSVGKPTKVYYSDGYAYQLYDDPSRDPHAGITLGQWYKMKVPDELWAAKFHTLDDKEDSLIAWLYFDPKVTIIGIETINGVDCYKVSITPDFQEINSKYFPGSTPVPVNDLQGFGWIEKSTFNLVKSELSYTLSLPNGPGPGDDLPADYTNTTYFSQINQVSVVLPQDVQNAVAITPPPETNDQTTLAQALTAVKLASDSLDSFYLKSRSTTGAVTTTITVEADLKNNIVHFTQSDNRYNIGVTEYYFLPDATYVKSAYPDQGMQPDVWYKLPPTPADLLPHLVLFQQRIISALESSSLAFGMGGVNDIPCYSFNFLDKGGTFISPNPDEISNVRFYAMAEKETFRIIWVVIDYTWTQNGLITTTHQQIDVSQFDQVTVLVPQEVINAITLH
ncbi:MAG: zf-HC2 domain-containing protein [Dehalogenimonas sp.]